jgi:hypothetical protein
VFAGLGPEELRIAHSAEHAEDRGDRGRDQEVSKHRRLPRMGLRRVSLMAAVIFVLEIHVNSR